MHKKRKFSIRIFIMGWILFGCAVCINAGQGPEIIKLDALVNIYGPVLFEHEMHEDVTSCATCHHHTMDMPAENEKCLRCHQGSGEADEITCSGCHTARPGEAEKFSRDGDESLYHIDVTGLKRAYHLQCMGCHVEMGAASGCEDCHPKAETTMQ